MDDALYRLHAEREETYWWWVGKNRIIMALIEEFWVRRAPGESGRGGAKPRALDIGCGAGGMLAKLCSPPLGFDAVGIDMSPIAREYCAKRGLRALDGSLPDGLPFTEPESLDVIVMSEVIEHVKEDRASVAVAARLLRPGGVLVCTVPAHMWLWSAHDDFNFHQRRYTRAAFAGLFRGLDTPLEERLLGYYQAASFPLVVAGRWASTLRARLSRRPPAEPVVRPLPAIINWPLTKGFEMEKSWLRRGIASPWGTSVISVHTRTDPAFSGA
ncbi:MAG TPA: class I SAM-dependent methyltransferase [Phycisphaerales bacterium]|nr:class I SAM-dependent methyltransferase [Phycisphaerales bacterium]